MSGEFLNGVRCPRCNSTLLHDAGKVWCSFIGGQDEKACAYGIDAPRSLVPMPDPAPAPAPTSGAGLSAGVVQTIRKALSKLDPYEMPQSRDEIDRVISELAEPFTCGHVEFGFCESCARNKPAAPAPVTVGVASAFSITAPGEYLTRRDEWVTVRGPSAGSHPWRVTLASSSGLASCESEWSVDSGGFYRDASSPGPNDIVAVYVHPAQPAPTPAANADEAAELRNKVAKLEAFKAFVHRRLDEGGVPADPPGEHRDRGCRVGQRLAWLFAQVPAKPVGVDEGMRELVTAPHQKGRKALIEYLNAKIGEFLSGGAHPTMDDGIRERIEEAIEVEFDESGGTDGFYENASHAVIAAILASHEIVRRHQ